MNRKRLKQLVSIIVIGLVAYFFAKSLSANWQNVSGDALALNGYSVLSITLFMTAVVLSGVLWGRILNVLSGKTTKTSEAVRVHTSSWLLKYVPGQAGSYVNKMAWGSKHGFDKKLITMSFIYENIFLLLASVALSIPVIGVIFYDDFTSNSQLFLPLALVLVCLPLLNKKFFYALTNRLLKLVRREPITDKYVLESRRLVSFFLGFLVPRLITGLAFVCVTSSFLDIEPSMYAGLIATYILAGIIGLLAVFVPSGLGVREAVIVVFMSNYFPTEVAITLALVARLYSTLADGLLALLYASLTSRQKIRS